MTDIVAHNRKSWNATSAKGASEWSIPVDAATIARAREGDWSVVLTPTISVPRNWFGDLAGKDVLGLASGGGQQVPILAAAEAHVTSFDNSDEQLARDGEVATREGLEIALEQGDMADLSRFADASFDLVFHPVSNIFAADVMPVWREAFRVLRPDGRLLSGFMNPDLFLFDWEPLERDGTFIVKFKLPYADTTSLTPEELKARMEKGEPLEHSHSFDTQIGGQLKAGFRIDDFYEDRWGRNHPTHDYMACSFATLAVKP